MTDIAINDASIDVVVQDEPVESLVEGEVEVLITGLFFTQEEAMKTKMLDLKVYAAEELGQIPSPEPGRVIVFAQPDGLYRKLENGDIEAVGGGGGGVGVGGGIVEPVQSLRFVELASYENMPNHGIDGEVTFGYVYGELVKQMPDGSVLGLDNTVRWTPPGGGGGPE